MLIKFRLLTFLAFAFLLGCQPQTPVETDQELPVAVKKTDYLKLPLNSQVGQIDPGLVQTPVQMEVIEQLFLGLTGFNPNTFEVTPRLATEWNVDETGTVYTFTLRQDAYWSDGQPVTAHDVVWAVRRNIREDTHSPYSFMLHVLKNAETVSQSFDAKEIETLGIKALDDYTLQFTLKQPLAYFPALTNLWVYRPLPRHVAEQHEFTWSQPDYIQTNGPYKLLRWKEEESLVLEKNPYYFDAAKVNIEKVHYYIVSDRALGLAMYEKDQLDILGGQGYLPLPEKEVGRVKIDPVLRTQLHVEPQLCTEWYGFNVQKWPTNSLFVRKAISAAIDKTALIKLVLKNEHEPATTFVRPPIFGSVDPDENVGIQFNPQQAKRWLADAGYPDAVGLPKLVLTYHNSEIHRLVADTVKTMLKHYLNLDVEIQSVGWTHYVDTLAEKAEKPHIFRMGWCADYPDANNWLYEVFHPDAGINWVGWQSEEFTHLIEEAQQVPNPAKRKKLYRRAEQVITEKEAVIAPIFFYNTLFLVKPWIKNWSYIPFGGQPIEDWVID